MRVFMIAMGNLEKELGSSRFSFDLQPGARLEDFYNEIGKQIADRIPESLWNASERRFRGPVVLISNNKVLRDVNDILQEGQEITVFKVLVGG